MYTIDKNISNEIIIKNSRFICVLYKVNSISEVNEHLISIRNLYKDATHYCSAYICGDYKKSSDDGEPGGTAGIPMLQVLEKNELNYILCIVIRYFGGIKLGAGGLVRAYTKSVTEALKNVDLIELIKGFDILLQFSYDKVKQIDYLLKDNNVVMKKFENIVTYRVYVSSEVFESLKMFNDVKIEILNDVYI